ncbi:MAG: hypothetical protein QOD53_941 [Thermoleophilaceae bacterium]|jgi:hypothetical protein|nr:hypothetical protein [Thermoleophilaceae bacterium]
MGSHGRGRVTRVVPAVMIAIALLAAPPAQAKSFGANLHRAANGAATCQSFIFFQQVPSCSWTTSGALFNPAESMVVPGTGTITRLRIKVGPQTGPMRIAILQSLRQENGGEAACCIGRRQTKVFTPKPNAVKTLKVKLRVSSTFNKKSRIYAFDSLFLTMENAGTPIPANVSDPNSDNCSGGWFPAVRPRQENYTGPYGVCGYTILIRADWKPRKRHG